MGKGHQVRPPLKGPPKPHQPGGLLPSQVGLLSLWVPGGSLLGLRRARHRRPGSFPLGLKHLQFKEGGLACPCGPPHPLHFKNGDAVLQQENYQAECVPCGLSFPRMLGWSGGGCNHLIIYNPEQTASLRSPQFGGLQTVVC